MVVELKLYSSSCPNPWLLPSCGGAAIEAKKYFTQDESMLSIYLHDYAPVVHAFVGVIDIATADYGV